MKEITSVNNELIKQTAKLQQKKYRNQTNSFLIEGIKGIKEAFNSGLELEQIFLKKDSSLDISDFENFTKAEIFSVTEPILKKISTTDSPPEIVASCVQKKFKLGEIFKDENPFALVLEDIKDAGNLGTIIRTAAACKASGIILTGESVDIYNPKAVRATAGNLWKVPIVSIEEKKELKKRINSIKPCRFLATAVDNNKMTTNLYKADLRAPSVIMLGSEADGLSQELIKLSDCLINIPMEDNIESLNLSISAGVILYESLRQRLYG